jgi:hypothetical protein
MTLRNAAPPPATIIAERLAGIRREIDSVRRPYTHDVEVVAVTKGFDPSVVGSAVEAGCRAIGENYAQELVAKRDEIVRAGAEVHFIGRLQTNKVRLVASLVDVWASVDRASVVVEIARRRPGARVLIQVAATDDPAAAAGAKGGCAVTEVPGLVELAVDAGLVVDGLMTVGPTDRPAEAARAGFVVVRSLVDELGLTTCSMGMSADLRVAVEEGATEVRIGTALFGPRR